MLPLGTRIPAFSLPDIRGENTYSVESFKEAPALLVVFLCAHCPYVHHVAPELARLGRDYAARGAAIVGITSNDIAQYPQDAPEPTARWAEAAGISFPVLYDQSQAVAHAFTAACTPDFFLFGPERTLLYRGQLDESRPSRGPDRPGKGQLSGRDLRAALDAVLGGRAVSEEQMPSIGCSIKWRE
jgi:peroxiredoxin